MKSLKMGHCRKTGFTIIELLTVVAIIGLLVAILIPTIGGVLNTAKTAKTKVQFSQWALGMEAFRQEYGYYPDVVDGDGLLDSQEFVREMTGLEIDGSDPSSPYGNVKKIRFLDFTQEELVGARIIDGFENTEIFVVIDDDYNGQVEVEASDSVQAGFNPSGDSLSPGDDVIRSGIVFFSAGAGKTAADIVKSWE